MGYDVFLPPHLTHLQFPDTPEKQNQAVLALHAHLLRKYGRHGVPMEYGKLFTAFECLSACLERMDLQISLGTCIEFPRVSLQGGVYKYNGEWYDAFTVLAQHEVTGQIAFFGESGEFFRWRLHEGTCCEEYGRFIWER